MTKYDFSLGDWVRIGNGEETRVTALADGYLRVADMFSDQAFKDIGPISITPEILEKNGFKKDVHNCSVYYDWSNSDGDDVILRRYPCGYFEVHITDNETLRNVRFPIDYVHELQHALRLCKIDKEIELW